jgi:hypothetical protein
MARPTKRVSARARERGMALYRHFSASQPLQKMPRHTVNFFSRWKGDDIKISTITHSERLAKYNRLLAIEAERNGTI